ncbi:MAG: hypothetical protein K1X83_02770 [Oligoflexia bacterium]|nr:hypothetical protein [Oligoflexia bacterium]
MLCVSITVHEQLEVIENQLRNVRRYLPASHIILHLSFEAHALRTRLLGIADRYENVFLNPIMYPTEWGWMYHAHLFNFEYAQKLGLDFDYFVTEASNTMYFRLGGEEYLKHYDFLSCSMPLDFDNTDWANVWNWKSQIDKDSAFWRMVESEKITKFYRDWHEGTAWKRELFEEMLAIISRYYQFDLKESRYPREEIYPSTLARHLSQNFSHPLVGVTWGEQTELVNRNLAMVSDAAGADPGYFGVKPVPRNMADPLRQFINGL